MTSLLTNPKRDNDIMMKSKVCRKCKKYLSDLDLFKIVMFVVDQKFTDHHYEHVECPDRFSV